MENPSDITQAALDRAALNYVTLILKHGWPMTASRDADAVPEVAAAAAALEAIKEARRARAARLWALADEYGKVAEATGNGDLAALVFQLHACLESAGLAVQDQARHGEVSVDEDIEATWIPLPGGGVRFLP